MRRRVALVGILVGCSTLAVVGLMLLLADTKEERGALGEYGRCLLDYDVDVSSAARGLGEPEASETEDLPIPETAAPGPCRERVEGGPHDIDSRSFLLPEDVSFAEVVAWYQDLGLAGLPWKDWTWCAEEGRPDSTYALQWTDRAADRVLLLLVSVNEDPLFGDPTEGRTYVDTSTVRLSGNPNVDEDRGC